MRGPLRIRLVFDDRHLLTKGQRSESLRRCWCLLTPDIATIADLASHISRLFELYRSCPDGVLLVMDGFVLPAFESSSIIRDKDIISVRKKTVKTRKVVNIEDHDALQMQDCEIVEKQTIACGDQLLAIKGSKEELEGHESEDEENADDHPEKAISEETPVGVQINLKRKKCSSEDLGSRRKKLKQTSFDELIEASVRVDEIHIEQNEVSLKKKARSSKNGHKKWKVPSSDFVPDGMITPKVGVNDKKMGGSVSSGRGKELKSTSSEELIGASERNDEIHLEKDDFFSKKRGGSSKKHKKCKVPLGDTVSDGMFTAEVGTRNNNMAGSVTSEERHKQVEGEIEINGCEALTEGVSKFPSRSTRRKKAKRKWKQLLASSKKQEDPGNDVQITSSKNQSSGNQGNDQMEENLMPQTTELQNVEQTTDTDEEVIPIVVRPGYIRFEPVDAEQSTQQTNRKMEAFHWNGTTNKKKGQKWGREKALWREDNHDNVHSVEEANEIKDGVSLVNDQIDFEKLMPLTSQPKEGDVLAYRLVELSSSWSPELSSFRIGKVSSYDPISKKVILLPVPNFPVFPDKEKEEEEEEEVLWQTNGSVYKEDGSLEIDYASLMDVRVFKPNKQPVLANSKHGSLIEETIIRTGDLNPVLTNNNINGTMNLTTDKTPDNEWKEIKQALDEKKEQLLKDGSSSSKNVSTSARSYRAVRGAALGPTIALLRAKNDV